MKKRNQLQTRKMNVGQFNVERLEQRCMLTSLGNILTLGDSITQSYNQAGTTESGFHPVYGYQYELAQQLDEFDFSGKFVGGQFIPPSPNGIINNKQFNPGVSFLPPLTAAEYPAGTGESFLDEWTNAHQGFGAATSVQILDGFAPRNLDPLPVVLGRIDASDTPDIALVHLGTNDVRIFNAATNPDAIVDGVAAIDGIIDELQLKNSNMTIFVANIVPLLNKTNETIDFNDALDIAAVGWSTPTSEVIVVDHHSSFMNSNGNPIGHYYWDDLHQTRAGQQRMAATWMKGLMDWRIEAGDYGGNVVQTPDLDANGVIDAGDMDQMISILNGAFNINFDYDKDGDNDETDLKFFVKYIVGTSIGDANVDAIFNSTDFTVVFESGEFEDGIANNSTWAEGDWNGDGDFDTADLVFAFLDAGFIPE